MISEKMTDAQQLDSIAYNAAIESVKTEVEKALRGSPSLIRGYTAHLTQSRGKFIRALSLVTCAMDGMGLVHPNAVQWATGVEILHLATLVHDDVIDNAKTRRGVITLQKKFGRRSAVICGDYLFCVALRYAGSVPNREDYIHFDLPDYMGRVCLGELRQGQNNRNFDLSVFNYLKIIAGKTAALFEASFYAGAVLCPEAKEEIPQYMRLGHCIGMIFQLTDDCIDFEASAEQAQKPVQSDYEQGVITLPLIYAFAKQADFKQKAETSELTREEINRVVAETGGLEGTRRVSKKYYQKASAIIDSLHASEEKKLGLRAVLDKAYYGLKK